MCYLGPRGYLTFSIAVSIVLTIHQLNQNEYTAWDNYVFSHPEGSLFHLIKWKKAVEEAFGHKAFYFLAKEGGLIKGILPLFQIKSFLFGNIISSVPFAAYGGVLADSVEIFRELVSKSIGVTKELNADYLELKFLEKKELDFPGIDIYFTFIKELSADHDENFKAILRKQRRMVRVGIKSELKAIFSKDYLDDFYELFAINVHRLGTPVYSKKWFETLLDVLGNEAELLVIQHEGRIISGVISFYYKDTVLPYYAASQLEFRKFAPNDFQYWELMRHAVEKGCRFFDFGRSKKGTGHFNYKRHWGFEPTPLHYQFYLNGLPELPELNPLNPKYKWKIEAWKRLPLAITKMIGPYLVKYIP